MNIKTRQANIDFLQELEECGFHIDEPRKRVCRMPGDLTTYEGQPCQLLTLIEITEFRELWSVKFFNEPEPTYILF